MATTLREKRHRQCLNSIGRLTEQRELAFRRLAILDNRLADERRRLKRLQKELGKPIEPKLTPLPEAPAWVAPPPKHNLTTEAFRDAPPPAQPDNLNIPDFLDRRHEEAQRIKNTEAKDRAAAIALQAEQADRKLRKARARIAKMKAKQSGETRRMPLTGKAALKAIRGD